MNYDKRELIESILSFHSAAKLTDAIDEITEQMLNHGFEYEDVKEYIIEYLDDILGK